ncbi:MAG: hypothetical protein KF856_09730 [Cyclobacteriaceae bacterium]|nr:hypothetical protein [Cyclobacteriaceae bacterium]MBX2915533.1 hypothetical protein [Cyclobacteriaceae bacterium]
MKSLLMLFTVIIYVNFGYTQESKFQKKWDFSGRISFGSENNYGNPGLLFQTNLNYQFHKTISTTGALGFFHSLPELNKEPGAELSTFSAAFIGFNLMHTAVFNQNKNYVKIQGGALLINTSSIYRNLTLTAFDEFGNPFQYVVPKQEVLTKVGYHVGMLGGANLSEKVSFGLSLDIYSYQIFGDIVTIGIDLGYKF